MRTIQRQADDYCSGCGVLLVSCQGCAEARCLQCEPYTEHERLNRCCIIEAATVISSPRHGPKVPVSSRCTETSQEGARCIYRDGPAIANTDNAAIYELEARLRQTELEVDKCQRILMEKIDREKREHNRVELAKTTLNAAVRRRLDYEDALRTLRGSDVRA